MLTGSSEADLTRLPTVQQCRGRCCTANQVVTQECCPHFLAYHLWRFAAYVVQVKRLLDRTNIEFSVPVIMPPKVVLLSCCHCCDRSHCLSSILSSSCFGVMSSVG